MTDFVKMTYVQINEQVTLQNQDPVKKFNAGLKPSLIDLEAYGVCYGDKGEGFLIKSTLNDLTRRVPFFQEHAKV